MKKKKKFFLGFVFLAKKLVAVFDSKVLFVSCLLLLLQKKEEEEKRLKLVRCFEKRGKKEEKWLKVAD